MNTRKPRIVVIANESVYNTAVSSLPVIVKPLMDNFDFIRIDPENGGLDVKDFKPEDMSVNKYLIKLAPGDHKISTIFDKVFPENTSPNDSSSENSASDNFEIIYKSYSYSAFHKAFKEYSKSTDTTKPDPQKLQTLLDKHDAEPLVIPQDFGTLKFKKRVSPNSQSTINEVFRLSFQKIRESERMREEQAEMYQTEYDDCMQAFKKAPDKIKQDSKVPFFLRRTRITDQSTLEDILKDALHKSSSDAMKVAVQLKWLDESGNPGDETPDCIKQILETIRYSTHTRNQV